METETQHNASDKRTKTAIMQSILSRLEKKEAKISIALAIIGILVTVLFEFHESPEKEDKIFRKNLIGGENQMAVKQIPAVQSFVEYLEYIENKDTMNMWNLSSSSRRSKDYANIDKMMYDYFLTSDYQVDYIIPIKEENKLSLNSNSPINEHTFSFYALLEFEDDVCLDGEVDKLKSFHKTVLKDLCDSASFEQLFDPVVEEIYVFLDKRFVIDSAEYIKSELRDYMKEMTLKNYITQDWRFPVLFAQKYKLPPKPQVTPVASYERQGHMILCRVVMIEEDVWKVKEFRTIAISRWSDNKNK